jgi:hypothetical protein
MVSLEPSEPLLLYVATMIEVVSMLLVMERPESRQPQVPKGAFVGSSGSQDPEAAEMPGDGEAAGSQLPEPSHAPEPQAGSQPSEPVSSSVGHAASESELLKTVSDPGGSQTHGGRCTNTPP